MWCHGRLCETNVDNNEVIRMTTERKRTKGTLSGMEKQNMQGRNKREEDFALNISQMAHTLHPSTANSRLERLSVGERDIETMHFRVAERRCRFSSMFNNPRASGGMQEQN